MTIRRKPPQQVEANRQVLEGIKNVVKCPNLWLASMSIFFVYSAYCGLTYFIPFLKDILRTTNSPYRCLWHY